MKKLLWIVLAIFLIIVAALVVFVVTFDLNRMKPMIISQIETAVGNPVQIDRLSLGWKGGIALSLTGLRIYPDEKAGGEPAITIHRVNAFLSLKQLLKRQIAIGSIVIDYPSLHLLRSGDGAVHVIGFNPKKTQSKAPASQTNALAAIPVLINKIRLEEGSLRFTDATTTPPSEIQIRHIDVFLDQVFFNQSVKFDTRLALLSERHNVFVNGRFLIPLGKNPGALENVRLKVDLGNISSEELARAIPGLERLALGGEAVMDLDRVTFDTKGFGKLNADLQLRDGKIASPQLARPIENIGASISVEKDRLLIKNFSADLAGGKLEASGSIGHIQTAPISNLRGTLRGISLESLQSQVEEGAPRLQGKLGGFFEAAFSGLSEAQIINSLSGEIEMNISEPVIVNFNLVREVFGRLALIPGLVNTLEKRLPEHYGEKLRRRDTALEPIQLEGRMEPGRLIFDRVLLVSDTFVLTGRIAAGIDGSILSDAVLRLDPDLSAAFIRSVEELQYLTDREGRLEIPVQIRSEDGHFTAVPDLQYVAAKLAVAKTQEVIGKWLEKKAGPKSEEEKSEADGQTTPQGDLMGSLIGGLLKDKP